MTLIVAVISILTIAIGIHKIRKDSLVTGILRLLAAVFCPVVLALFTTLQSVRCYGGTKWAFILYSLRYDGDPILWIVFLVMALEVVFFVRDSIKIAAGSKCDRQK